MKSENTNQWLVDGPDVSGFIYGLMDNFSRKIYRSLGAKVRSKRRDVGDGKQGSSGQNALFKVETESCSPARGVVHS